MKKKSNPDARFTLPEVLKAIRNEPEYPGKMPDEMWEKIKGDRDAVEEALRITVRLTKEGIRNRILNT